ncbi:hypothetical protein [Liquorilactobacillus sicerae]|uniref:hypothetical protein n=1 Tax=Liquorilactobacillus sicerae TaxID=1416943 RepID=UPI00247FDE3F|nr:hypothetical protein [Liquorilactobacillus sicerae]
MPKDKSDLIKKDIDQRLKAERTASDRPAKSSSAGQKVALIVSLLIALGIVLSLLQVLF